MRCEVASLKVSESRVEAVLERGAGKGKDGARLKRQDVTSGMPRRPMLEAIWSRRTVTSSSDEEMVRVVMSLSRIRVVDLVVVGLGSDITVGGLMGGVTVAEV